MNKKKEGIKQHKKKKGPPIVEAEGDKIIGGGK